MHGDAVVEADEEVLADRIGADQCGAGQIDADQSRVSGDAALAPLAGEVPIDLVGQTPDGVAFWHERRLRFLRRR